MYEVLFVFIEVICVNVTERLFGWRTAISLETPIDSVSYYFPTASAVPVWFDFLTLGLHNAST